MASREHIHREEEDEDLAAARWVMGIEQGLEPGRAEAFHAWLAERPERAELIARQAALQSLAKRADEYQSGLTSRRRLLVGGAIGMGAAAFGGAALVVRAPWLDTAGAYETRTGEVRAVELPDASRLWLDTRTRASARMTRARRAVTLAEGRLFIEVAHEPKRPFLVRGAHFEARAVGTAFEASVFAGRAGVAVSEGVVRFRPWNGGPAIDLAAGQGAWVTEAGEVTRTIAAAPGVAAWRQRRMVLSDRRLDAALAELSRYFDRPLIATDAQLAARRVSLSFSIADLSEKDVARTIAGVVGADIVDRANAGILLSPAAS